MTRSEPFLILAPLSEGAYGNDGCAWTHFEVPLSDIVFQDGQIDTTRADLKAIPEFVAWLEFLSRQKRLTAADKPIATAMILAAVEQGVVGNSVQLIVIRKTDTTVDLTVKEIDTYTDLTMATLRARLGEETGPTLGSQPGLLHVETFPAGSDTLTVTESANPVPPTGGNSPKWTLVAGGPTLKPRRSAGFNTADQNSRTIAISNVSPDGLKFTLTVTWAKTERDVAVGGLGAALGNLGYLITATPPDGGYKLPRPGTVRLTEGAEAVSIPPKRAGATVIAKE
jgi:hypothetical protein